MSAAGRSERAAPSTMRGTLSNIFRSRPQRSLDEDNTGAPSNTYSSELQIGADSKKSYWHEAEEKLKMSKPHLSKVFTELRSRNLSSTDELLAAVMAGLKAREHTFKEREHVLPFKIRVHATKLRDQFNTLAKSILAFKDCGSLIARLDPYGVAPLVWGGVCLVLQISLNDSEDLKSALEGVAEISPIIARWARVEDSYVTDQNGHFQSEFESCLISLYASILEYQASLVVYLERGRVSRAVRSIPRRDDSAGLQRRVREKDATCRGFTEIFDTERSRSEHKSLITESGKLLETLKSQDVRLRDLQSSLDLVLALKDEKENSEILEWIPASSPIIKHEDILRSSNLGTTYLKKGKWLRDHNLYVMWLNSKTWSLKTHQYLQHPVNKAWNIPALSSAQHLQFGQHGTNCLWVHGPAGTGKTAITALLIEWFLEKDLEKDDEQLLFYYCSNSKGGSSGSPPMIIFHSFLKQMAWDPRVQRISGPIRELYSIGHKQGPAAQYLSIQRCINTLQQSVSTFRRVTIVVDALDECADPSTLLRSLQTFCQCSPEKFQIYLSSRDHIRVKDSFPNLYPVNIVFYTSPDLRSFIEKEARSRTFDRPTLFLDKSIEQEVRKEIARVLTQQSGAMFRWAELQLSFFFGPYISLPEDIRDRLQVLSRNVGDPHLTPIYDQIYHLNTFGSERKLQYARKAYLILLGALRPLYLHELTAAVALRPDGTFDKNIQDDYVLEITRNFIIHHQESHLVQFAHLSVKDYLVRQSKSSAEYAFNICAALMTDLCLTELLTKSGGEFSDSDTASEKHRILGFETYARSFWPDHCRQAQDSIMNSEALRTKFFQFLHRGSQKSEGRRNQWWETYGDQAFYRQDLAGKKERAIGRTPHPMFVASAYGMDVVLQEVIRWRGSSSQLKATNIDGETPFEVACSFGGRRVVEILLRQEPRVLLKYGRNPHLGPLKKAVLYGQVETVKLLLSTRQPILDLGGTYEYFGRTRSRSALSPSPLIIAAGFFDTTILRSLLQKFVAVCERKSGRLVLVRAVAERDQLVPEWPLQEDSIQPLEIQDDFYGNSALHVATRQGSANAVSILLHHGANPNSKNLSGDAPIHIAAQSSLEKVSILLQYGALINEPGHRGGTALHTASCLNLPHIVSYLLDHDADMEKSNQYGQTPLGLAAAANSLQVAHILIERGASTRPNSTVKHPITEAAWNGHSEMITLLLDKGAQIDLGRPSALEAAVRTQRRGLISQLLSRDASLNNGGTDGWYLLHFAAFDGYEDIVQLLLDGGANIGVIGPGGYSPLDIAVFRGHRTTAKLLYERGVCFAVITEEAIDSGFRFPVSVIFSLIGGRRGFQEKNGSPLTSESGDDGGESADGSADDTRNEVVP